MLFKSNPISNKIRYYFSLLMVGIYLVIGVLFLFSDIAVQTFPVYRTKVGLLFTFYAGFRLFVTIREKNKDQPDE